MTDIQIRNANVRDCELIVRFLRAALQDMEAAGSHIVNSNEDANFKSQNLTWTIIQDIS